MNIFKALNFEAFFQLGSFGQTMPSQQIFSKRVKRLPFHVAYLSFSSLRSRPSSLLWLTSSSLVSIFQDLKLSIMLFYIIVGLENLCISNCPLNPARHPAALESIPNYATLSMYVGYHSHIVGFLSPLWWTIILMVWPLLGPKKK